MRLTIPAIIGAFVGLLGLSVVGGSFYTIDERERGVLLRNGAVAGVANPGLGFKMPFIDTVREISVETHKAEFKQLAAYSRDQQPATMVLSVNWRIDPSQVVSVYQQYRDIEGIAQRLIYPRVNEATKNVFGGFNAVTAIQERARLNTEVQLAITEALKGTQVVIEGVQIENIDFSDAYEASIEQRMLAEVEVQKVRQNAERERVAAEIAVTKAAAQADALRKQAQAEADAIRLKGEAEAQAIRARGAALRDNPQLVDLVQAERWDGKLPQTMVPGGSVPMIGVSK